MSKTECERERELVDLVRSSRWPDGADDELCAHVAACVVCGDLAAVAPMIASEFNAALARVRVPSSGVMWWRAQRRAREEAAAAARRAVTLVQAVSVAVGAVLVTAALPAIRKAAEWSDWSASGSALLHDVVRVSSSSVLLTVAVGACLTIAPLALFVALREE